MNAVNPSELWKKRLGDWVVNPYVGCMHGCVLCYCPAMPGVKFFNGKRAQSEWGTYVIPKAGIMEALRRQLRNFTPEKAKRTDWGDGWVLMSFLTDCYQPIEASQKLTRACLQLLLEAGHKVRIQTRGVMVRRDFDLLRAHPGQVLLGTSIPSTDEALTRILEPKAASLKLRWKMLEAARDAGIPVYLAIAPVMPWTSADEVMTIMDQAFPLEPKEIFCEVLNPKGGNLRMVERALSLSGRRALHIEAAGYDSAEWAKKTFSVLVCGVFTGAQIKPGIFVPWPDTGRSWVKQLHPEQVAWLDQFLPPKEAVAA